MKKEFSKAQIQQSFDDGVGAGKSGVDALLKEVYEKHAKQIDGINREAMKASLAHDEELTKFKNQIEEQVKKVDTINKTATEQINALQIKCQEFATAIRLLSRNI